MISLGCSGYVYGLSVIKSFMKCTSVVCVTSDPYSKIIDINDKSTSLLFGDGATVTLIKKRTQIMKLKNLLLALWRLI